MSEGVIENLADLQRLVKAGETDWKQYGSVRAVEWEGLILFDYSALAQYENRWNFFERVSRGLILNRKTGKIVALPFEKFFNFGEYGHEISESPISEITEKLDGSFGILYRHKGRFRISTRGSFTSREAIWATKFLEEHYPQLESLPKTYTLLFEIIFPENRVVINYQGRQALVLIGVRDILAHTDWSYEKVKILAQAYGFPTAKTYTFKTVEEILEAAAQISANEEGWVVRQKDGSRFKIKGDAYRLAHRLMTMVSFKTVLKAVIEGQYDQMIEGVPDEFLAEVKAHRQRIETGIALVLERVNTAMNYAPVQQHWQDEKQAAGEFAQWVMAHQPIKKEQAYLFAARVKKDLLPLIYKHEFDN